MNEETMTKKQRREMRKEERMEEQKKQQKRAKMNKAMGVILVAILLVLIGWGIFFLAKGEAYPLSVTDPTKGPENAPVVIEEFSDFQCPACRAAYRNVKQLAEEYPTQLKFVYKDFPLVIHDQADEAARGALCAAQQGKFWEFHDALFEQQSEWASRSGDVTAVLDSLVAEHELNREEWETCKDSRDVKRAIRDDLADGARRDVNSTPTFFVNGQKVEGGRSLFQWIQRVNEELQKKGLTPENEPETEDDSEAENTDENQEEQALQENAE